MYERHWSFPSFSSELIRRYSSSVSSPLPPAPGAPVRMEMKDYRAVFALYLAALLPAPAAAFAAELLRGGSWFGKGSGIKRWC